VLFNKKMVCNGRDGRSALLVRNDLPYQGRTECSASKRGTVYKARKGGRETMAEKEERDTGYYDIMDKRCNRKELIDKYYR